MSTIDRQAIIDALSRLVTPGIKLTALADEIGARKPQYAALREVILDLVEDGTVQVLPGGAFALAPSGRPGDPAAKPIPAPRAAPVRSHKPPTPKPASVARTARTPWSAAPRPPSDKAARATGDGAAPAAGPARQVRRPTAPPRLPREEYDPETGDVRPVGDTISAGVARPGERPDRADDRIIGRITVHPAGYGFVATEEGETVFVPAKFRGTSLDGDRVAVDTWPGVRGTEGRVSEVLARGRARLTGVLRRAGRAVYLEPDDPRISSDYGRVALEDAPLGKDGDAIVIEITRYPDAARRELGGKLLKVLGDPEDPRTEIEKILACAVIPIEFPDEAAAQARATAQDLGPADLADRIDLRDRRFATIDPETARDFDDALCIEDGLHGGPRVWVAVADVSHYVRWDDALDKEAQIRGVSVYLPDRVIPMLPHQLSASICSLNPMVDRCAMVVRLDYNHDAELVDVGYAAAVIRSKARLDYPGVAAALEGDFRGRREEYRQWAGELARLDALARQLRKKRQARGALELELSEPKVVLDADDPRLVRDVVKAKGDPAVKQAYQLVEEFMIAANEAVGNFFRRRGAPTVWRVHAPPKADRVATLAELLGAYGITVDVEQAATPLGMKRVLDQIAEQPGAQALSFLVLRTLTQAVWDTVPIGHFGLASGDYLHSTSPIRRYPDLLVHRLLKYHLHREGHASGGGYTKAPPAVSDLSTLAHASSEHERRAMEAEREAVAMYRAYLMRDQIGQRFDGVVSAVTSFGAFVEIDEPYVEGLIKLESLGDEQFSFDGVHMRLSGQRTGTTLSLGDKVTVEVNNVSVVRRRIDFTLVVAQTAGRKPRKAADRTRRATAPEAAPHIGLARRKKAGREVERATRAHAESGATPRRAASTGGKLRLGVSHRGPRDDGDGERKKPKRRK
ncbi:MAG: ribonuclease R [Deltaproteobacteria bacterium]|nr:MAG: ribonuclease R [Deltaproteobacteria bacterium]